MTENDVNEDSNGVVVTLKRKVRSLETNLLEWRRCVCTLTRDGQLMLELSDDDVVFDDEEGNGDAGHQSSAEQHRDAVATAQVDESRRGKCRVVVDLGIQLRSLEQKRKHKTRCELAYALRPSNTSTSSSGGLVVRTEELMASSAKHCQRFIDSVREAERHAERKHSMRIGALLAASSSSGGGATQRICMIEEETRIPLKNAVMQRRAQSSHASSSSGGKQDEVSQPSVTGMTPQHGDSQVPDNAIFSFAAAASFSSSTGSEYAAGRPQQQSSSDQDPKYWPSVVDRACESDTLDTSNTSEPLALTPANPTLSASSSRVIASSSPMSNSFSNSTGMRSHSDSVVLPTKPLPADLFAKRFAAIRLGARDGTGGANDGYDRLNQRDLASDEDDEEDDDGVTDRFGCRRVRMAASPRIRATRGTTPRIALPRRAHTGSTARHPSIGSNRTASSKFVTPTRGAVSSRRRTSCSSSTTTSTAATLAANLDRLRRRDDAFPTSGYDDADDDNGIDSNRAELHILMRVEAALRQLEKENAAAKEREHLLTQEAHALRDALRVKSAEKKHVDAQFRSRWTARG
ncbi:hypothetical protein FI667_g12975, partial [Globisporangium splendens]